jgi:hypothetical protein
MFCSLLACAQTAAVLQTGIGIYMLTCSLTAARATVAHLSTHFKGRIGLLGLRIIAGRSCMEENAVLLPCCRSSMLIQQRHSFTVCGEGLQVWTLEPLDCSRWG